MELLGHVVYSPGFLMWVPSQKNIADVVLSLGHIPKFGSFTKKMGGPRICPLCMIHEESNSQLFLYCAYSHQVCREVEGFPSFYHLWSGYNIEDKFQISFLRKELECFVEVPNVVLWGSNIPRGEI